MEGVAYKASVNIDQTMSILLTLFGPILSVLWKKLLAQMKNMTENLNHSTR